MMLESRKALARAVSDALSRTWTRLDAHLDMPREYVRQHDVLRQASPRTRSARDFFREVFFETVLLDGSLWGLSSRLAIPRDLRSSYLESLCVEDPKVDARDRRDDLCVDPGYSEYTKIVYSPPMTEGHRMGEEWRDTLGALAISDCARMAELYPPGTSHVSLAPRAVARALEIAFDMHGMRATTEKRPDGGFALVTPPLLPDLQFAFWISDTHPLRRKTISFDFLVFFVREATEPICLPNHLFWPGCWRYRIVCWEGDFLWGFSCAFALFFRTLADELAREAS